MSPLQVNTAAVLPAGRTAAATTAAACLCRSRFPSHCISLALISPVSYSSMKLHFLWQQTVATVFRTAVRLFWFVERNQRKGRWCNGGGGGCVWGGRRGDAFISTLHCTCRCPYVISGRDIAKSRCNDSSGRNRQLSVWICEWKLLRVWHHMRRNHDIVFVIFLLLFFFWPPEDSK